ncbi:hypothetical protein M0657_010964 [Pyricularia oryzae]|uniref:Uncharacterized protein n=2 Tax=Pyricularia oryzae TaxID=318829 RepID=A0AA97PKA7_PYRO3|nr:hypothetical protein OOU_Y34scaffold00587g5 [Pyricularia oryzae Y34]KAI7910618.1 hypothetical protein M9X92_010981 [Pyricularia oryzae]KAI7911401.1 hypothetical protein M0657_010964 [Pyricularia oryzae]
MAKGPTARVLPALRNIESLMNLRLFTTTITPNNPYNGTCIPFGYNPLSSPTHLQWDLGPEKKAAVLVL